MVIAFLGIMDLLAGIFFWIFGLFGIIPEFFINFFGMFILLKGLIFVWGKDFASVLDIIAALILMLAVVTKMPALIVIIVSLYLIQKGAMSLLTSKEY